MNARIVTFLAPMVLAGCFGEEEAAAPDEPLETIAAADGPVVLFAVHSANVVVPLACNNPVAGRLAGVCVLALSDCGPDGDP